MERRALITGVTGQDGSHLADLLWGKGYDVHGMIRKTSTDNTERIRQLIGKPRFTLHYGDLSDGVCLRGIVHDVRPHEVYNLAAHSHVPSSFKQPVYASMVDAVGVMQILESLRAECPEARFYQASSSEMFGKVAETPQSETTPFHPRSPYACAKCFGHWQTINYREAYGMFACSGILFNHEGPRRGEGFVTRKITLAATRIKAGLQKRLTLGNLDAKRDWGYAPEYVEAMWLMLQQDKPDDYVIATGRMASVREFLGLAFNQLGMDWKDYVDVSECYTRPAEVDLLLGNPAKAKKNLGWEAKTTLEELVKLMMDSDYNRACREKAAGMPCIATTD